MIYKYEIRNNGNEEILYLFIEMNYEFSKELTSNIKTNNKINEFIKNNSIKFKGNKVYLVTDGIIIKTYEIDKNEEKQLIDNKNYSNNSYIINLKYNAHIIKINLKSYLLGVLSNNCLNDLELTTIKAMTVLFRTYAYKQMEDKNLIDSNDRFLPYKPISYYKLLWRNNYQEIYNKLEKAINDTDGEFITYDNYYILPYFHICNNGNTNNGELPYLKRKASLWDYTSPYYLDIIDYDFKYLEELFSIPKEELKKIKILSISKSKCIEKIKIGDKIYDGETFKNLLNLHSSDINIIINPNYIRFITKGFGHNLGISEYGANEISKVGCSYTSILKYYFNDIKIKKYVTKKQV